MTARPFIPAFFALLCSSFSSGPAHADVWEIEAGLSQWRSDLQGHLQSEGAQATRLDLQGDNGFAAFDARESWIRFSHPLPLLPNVAWSRHRLSVSNTGRLPGDRWFAGSAFRAGSIVESTLDASHDQWTFFYTPLDTVVRVDAGLAIKQFDGHYALRDARVHAREAIEGTLPLLHARIEWPLLFDLKVIGELQGARWRGLQVRDSKLALRWALNDWLALEAGQKSLHFSVDADEENLDGNLHFRGQFASALVTF